MLTFIPFLYSIFNEPSVLRPGATNSPRGAREDGINNLVQASRSDGEAIIKSNEDVKMAAHATRALLGTWKRVGDFRPQIDKREGRVSDPTPSEEQLGPEEAAGEGTEAVMGPELGWEP